MFDGDNKSFGLRVFLAFGVGLLADILLLNLGLFILELKGSEMVIILIIIAVHLLISGWKMIFRWGDMEDLDFLFLRFGVLAILLRFLG